MQPVGREEFWICVPQKAQTVNEQILKTIVNLFGNKYHGYLNAAVKL
jgi:hypothetical protein